jgi:hypothetical protein
MREIILNTVPPSLSLSLSLSAAARLRVDDARAVERGHLDGEDSEPRNEHAEDEDGRDAARALPILALVLRAGGTGGGREGRKERRAHE